MKLNLGSGDVSFPGFLSVDLREDVADIVADVRSLDFAGDETVEEIVAMDILEHFPVWESLPILREWNRVLVPGGRATIRVPNLAELARKIHFRSDEIEKLIENIYGGHRWGPEGSWDTHHWGWTPETLERDLTACGFEVFGNDREPNMTLLARKVKA